MAAIWGAHTDLFGCNLVNSGMWISFPFLSMLLPLEEAQIAVSLQKMSLLVAAYPLVELGGSLVEITGPQ